ncbi:MAG: thioredoxin [Clostridia bacterium]
MTKEITKENFNSVVETDKPILIDFWAEWCAPCRMLGPIVEDIAAGYGDKVVIGKVNVDNQRELAQHFGIMGIPSVFILKDKQIVNNLVGVRPKKDYENALDSLLEPAV